MLAELPGRHEIGSTHRGRPVHQAGIDVPGSQGGTVDQALFVGRSAFAERAHEVERRVPRDVHHAHVTSLTGYASGGKVAYT